VQVQASIKVLVSSEIINLLYKYMRAPKVSILPWNYTALEGKEKLGGVREEEVSPS
jgi:hypothetical protein